MNTDAISSFHSPACFAILNEKKLPHPKCQDCHYNIVVTNIITVTDIESKESNLRISVVSDPSPIRVPRCHIVPLYKCTIFVNSHGGALVESIAFNRRIVDSTPALAAM